MQEHIVGLNPKETLQTRMPIDIEGHYGTDGRYYVLDAARLMPPEAPTGAGMCIKLRTLTSKHTPAHTLIHTH